MKFCCCGKRITSSAGVSFARFMAEITTMSTSGKCAPFMLVTLCCPANLHFHPFICCVWFVPGVSRWLELRFRAGGKILSVWSGRQKYGQHNRISSLVSALLPCRDIPMGTHFFCANHTRISAGCFLSGHERREDRRKRCKMGRERERRNKAPRRIMMLEIHPAPFWIEVIIISWPSIVLVLIAFQGAVILCSAVYSQTDILFTCELPVCCCILTAIWAFMSFHLMDTRHPLQV